MNRRVVLAVAAVAFVAAIVLVYLKVNPSDRGPSVTASGQAVRTIEVGALPVTCNLTGPIACMTMQNNMGMADMMTGSGPDTMSIRDTLGPIVAHFTRYSGWPEIKEALISGHLDAAYLLAPLAMDLADKGLPIRVVALGHRSGAVIMVPTASTARNFADLRGKRVAIPSRFAVDNLYVHRLMRQFNITDRQITLIEMAPPDMPAAMGAGAVDAYATGEPWGAKAERDGTGRVLHSTRVDWPDYICCVLAVRVDRLATTRPMIQYLVDNVMAAGIWLDRDSVNRVLAANVAGRPQYFNTDSTLIRYVLEHPHDRVTYGDLRLIRQQLDSLMELGIATGIINHPIPYESYTDESFIRHHRNVTVNLDSTRRNE